MICNHCGKETDNNAVACPFCGAQLQAQQVWENASVQQKYVPQQHEFTQQAQAGQPNTPPVQNYGAPNQNYTSQQQYAAYPNGTVFPNTDRRRISKKEYIEKYAPANLKKNINSTAYLLYGLSVFSLILNFVLAGFSWITLVEISVLVGLIVGMHIGKSKICAILLVVVSIAGTVITLILSGQVTGWWWIIASIYAVSCFNKLDKEYNSFLMNANGNTNPYFNQPQPEYTYAAQPGQSYTPPAQNYEAPNQNDTAQQTVLNETE